MLKKGIWALASVSSLRHALLCVPKPCPSFAGFFTQISTLADVQENVMEYLHVLSRPKVIDQEHDVVWTEAYIDSTVSLQGPGERLGLPFASVPGLSCVHSRDKTSYHPPLVMAFSTVVPDCRYNRHRWPQQTKSCWKMAMEMTCSSESIKHALFLFATSPYPTCVHIPA